MVMPKMQALYIFVKRKQTNKFATAYKPVKFTSFLAHQDDDMARICGL